MDERVELLRRAYETFNAGALDFSVLHPYVRVIQTPIVPGTAGVFDGHDGFRRCIRELLDGFKSNHFETESFEPLEDGRMLVRCRWVGIGITSDIQVDAPVWHIWSFRQGLIARMEIYPSERRARAAAQPS